MRTGRRKAVTRATITALAVTTLAGCALLSPAKTEITTARLEKMPAEVPRRDSRPITLLVFPPEAKPTVNTTQMAYTVRPYEVAYFSQHQWGGTPSQMLQPLLVRTLESAGYFKTVLTPPHTGRYSYALRTEILELTQDFTSEPAALRLSLRLRLSDDAANRVIATKEISLREPMRQKTPYAGVVAANEATAKALQEVAKFVLEKAD
jgi:cholesterol transport system auxiliary component